MRRRGVERLLELPGQPMLLLLLLLQEQLLLLLLLLVGEYQVRLLLVLLLLRACRGDSGEGAHDVGHGGVPARADGGHRQLRLHADARHAAGGLLAQQEQGGRRQRGRRNRRRRRRGNTFSLPLFGVLGDVGREGRKRRQTEI